MAGGAHRNRKRIPMTDIKWEAPPEGERRGARGTWKTVADALRARPGEWALISENADRSMTTRIKDGQGRAWRPAGSFEARGVGFQDQGRRRVKLYARYVGGDEG